MRKLLLIVSIFFTSLISNSQNVLHAGIDWKDESILEEKSQSPLGVSTAACGTPFLSTGYPLWTNYWAGWMVNIINTNACPIIINGFEARFQGTAGYSIYTKTGTFVGFQTTAGAWTLVGSLAALTGTSTTAPTSIPIAVNITIPPGATQAFYLTRSDNVIANRHLYVTGAGTAGTTIYASNADLSITEGNYVDPYFAALQVGVRRPSFDVCYTINCPLPIEIISFDAYKRDNYNLLTWISATETNNDYYTLERSTDGTNWKFISNIDGAGTSNLPLYYEYRDYESSSTIVYYRLKQTDFNGNIEYFDIIAIDNTKSDNKKVIKITNMMGQEVQDSDKREGVFIYFYSDGSYRKAYSAPK